MLGATSRGAIFSSCSADFGVQGVVDRFGQIEPRVLFTVDGYYYAPFDYEATYECPGVVGALGLRKP